MFIVNCETSIVYVDGDAAAFRVYALHAPDVLRDEPANALTTLF